ncbi:zona pellucida sperm-binding protein 4-like [Pelobates fuscus]|uniref:zona pellucida sperm-binding protein 4-like n=1 Tax=Pelobates fuscus TaxID=191477 RepID=UPI002FE442F8
MEFNFRVMGICLFLAYSLSLSNTQPSAHRIRIGNPRLFCGTQSLRYVVSGNLPRNVSMRVSALDQNGKLQHLSLHSACGTRLSANPNESVTIAASYKGCFVLKQQSRYIMTISIEREVSRGMYSFPQLEMLECPVFEEKPAVNLTSYTIKLSASPDPVFFPAVKDSSEISIKGSPVLPKSLDKEWLRIAIVVGVLAILIATICLLKKKCKDQAVKI